MAAIVTNKFRLNNAEQFYESFAEASTSFYLYVGRPQPWTITTPFGGGTDTAPPTPLDNVDDEYMYLEICLRQKELRPQIFNMQYHDTIGLQVQCMITIGVIMEHSGHLQHLTL